MRYALDLQFSLTSVGTLDRQGLISSFQSHRVAFSKVEPIFGTVKISGDLYTLCTHPEPQTSETVLLGSINRWHERLDHVNHEIVLSLSSRKAVSGLSISGASKVPSCQTCTSGSLIRQGILKSTPSNRLDILGIVHSDVCNPIEVMCKGGPK